MSAIFARPSKGKGVIHKRVENRRLSTLLCARAASAHSPPRDAANPPLDFKRKTSRPLGANTPAAVRVPRSAGAGKSCSQYSR